MTALHPGPAPLDVAGPASGGSFFPSLSRTADGNSFPPGRSSTTSTARDCHPHPQQWMHACTGSAVQQPGLRLLGARDAARALRTRRPRPADRASAPAATTRCFLQRGRGTRFDDPKYDLAPILAPPDHLTRARPSPTSHRQGNSDSPSRTDPTIPSPSRQPAADGSTSSSSRRGARVPQEGLPEPLQSPAEFRDLPQGAPARSSRPTRLRAEPLRLVLLSASPGRLAGSFYYPPSAANCTAAHAAVRQL